MQSRRYLLWIAFLPILLLTFSCKREKPWWDIDVAAPVATSSLGLGNLFPDTLLQSAGDGSLSLAYLSDLLNYSADSLIQVPDTTIIRNDSFPFPFGYITYGPGNQLFLIPQSETKYDLKGVELKLAEIRQGQVVVEVKSTIRQPTQFQYVVPSLKRNGITLDTTVDVPPGTFSNPGLKTFAINLAGYQVDLKGVSGNSFNSIVQYGEIRASPNAQPDTIKWKEGVVSKFSFKNVVPQYAQGYFGTDNLTIGPDTNYFDVFKRIHSGILDLQAASLNLSIVNEFGVDLRATINQVFSRNTKTGNVVVLNGTPLNTSYNVNRAVKTGNLSAPVIPGVKNLILNQNNSNLVPFITNLPDQIGYKVSGIINPLGNVSGHNDFAYYGTSLKGRLGIDIPLQYSATDLTILDTVLADLTGIKGYENVNYGNLILTAKNAYPFAISLQAYLLNENNQLVDSLFLSSTTINAPVLDANNMVVAPLESKLYIPVSQSRFERLKQTRKIYFKARFNTTNQPVKIKFYSHYKLDLLLTADFNYSVNK